MAQRVIGREIEITVGVCRFSINTLAVFVRVTHDGQSERGTTRSLRLLVMVSRKGKPCELVFFSSKVNCIFGLIEFKCL